MSSTMFNKPLDTEFVGTVNGLSERIDTLNEHINQLTKTFTGVMKDNGWRYVSKDVYGFGNIGIININGMYRTDASSGWSTAAWFPTGIKPAGGDSTPYYGYLSDDTNLTNGTTKVYQVRVSKNGGLEVYSPQVNAKMWGVIVFPCEIT